MSNFVTVMSKARKRGGIEYPSTPTEFSIMFIRDGKKIIGCTIARKGTTKRSFRVGDTAEYHSYNFSYTGQITSITEKGVSIVAYPDSPSARVHRLDLYNFCWRNEDFDLEETAKRNHEVSMYI